MGVNSHSDRTAIMRSEDLITAATELMMTRPKPRLVNVFCADAVKGNGARAGETPAHQDFSGLTQGLAASLPAKFRVNAVTVPPSEKQDAPAGEMFLRDDRDVAPDDVARIVLFLLSGEAVALNGQTLVTSAAARA
jgi:NAD(P)-dependent dehydrogenase (short-subunit alcohol dehydrogenase family)